MAVTGYKSSTKDVRRTIHKVFIGPPLTVERIINRLRNVPENVGLTYIEEDDDEDHATLTFVEEREITP